MPLLGGKMFKLKSEIQFDMAHYLSGYNGKCANIHGHRYRLIATLKVDELKQDKQTRGMVEDFGEFKKGLKVISDMFDHKLIMEDNEEGREIYSKLKEVSDFEIVLLPFRTTAEEMSRYIYRKLKEMNFPIYEVELFETPTNSIIYSEE